MNPAFLQNIEREGVPLYAAEDGELPPRPFPAGRDRPDPHGGHQ